MPISLNPGQVAGALAGEHHDPFDRMLVAQAREETMALLSNDAEFDQFGVERIWFVAYRPLLVVMVEASRVIVDTPRKRTRCWSPTKAATAVPLVLFPFTSLLAIR